MRGAFVQPPNTGFAISPTAPPASSSSISSPVVIRSITSTQNSRSVGTG